MTNADKIGLFISIIGVALLGFFTMIHSIDNSRRLDDVEKRLIVTETKLEIMEC